MHIVSICSLKGGVGKTSITLGLASAALARKVPTLVVDLDPQADATTGLDVVTNPASDAAGVFARPKRSVVEQAVVPSGWTADSPGWVDVLLGTERLAAVDALTHDGTVPDELRAALPTALRKLPSRYELVLIDCPPNLAALTRTGLAASDRALIVCEPGLFSVAAADRALKAIEEIRSSEGARVQPLGVVVNRFRMRRREHTYRVAELRDLFGQLVLNPYLNERSVLQQAQGAGRPIHRWPTAAGREMAKVFDDLLDQVLASASSPLPGEGTGPKDVKGSKGASSSKGAAQAKRPSGTSRKKR